MKKRGNDKLGVIFNIQRYSIHDGPGIRTVIFLKGCPLRCLWCSNPEGQNFDLEILYSKKKCLGCDICVDVCEENAITAFSKGKIIDHRKCTMCGECVRNCPGNALEIAGRRITVEELLGEIKKDKVFYHRSGGGVTFSGGEPASQPGFVRTVAEGCHEAGIHTAIETTGYQRWEAFLMILENMDLAMIDLKHMDEQEHKKLTGVANNLILDNIKRVSNETDISLIIRIPIIPGYNDSLPNLEASADFIRSLPRWSGVELIPYHRLGSSKYAKLNREYFDDSVMPPEDEKMIKIANHFRSQRIKIIIGG
jgi:pyruvate formate lyase activating enzyme